MTTTQMTSVSKKDIQNAIPANQWCVRPGGSNGLKLTHYFATLSTNNNTLTFKDKSKPAIGGIQSQGEESIIQGFVVDQKSKILYVRCENEKIYRLLLMNSHQKHQVGTIDDVIGTLTTKGISRLTIK